MFHHFTRRETLAQLQNRFRKHVTIPSRTVRNDALATQHATYLHNYNHPHSNHDHIPLQFLLTTLVNTVTKIPPIQISKTAEHEFGELALEDFNLENRCNKYMTMPWISFIHQYVLFCVAGKSGGFLQC